MTIATTETTGEGYATMVGDFATPEDIRDTAWMILRRGEEIIPCWFIDAVSNRFMIATPFFDDDSRLVALKHIVDQVRKTKPRRLLMVGDTYVGKTGSGIRPSRDPHAEEAIAVTEATVKGLRTLLRVYGRAVDGSLFIVRDSVIAETYVQVAEVRTRLTPVWSALSAVNGWEM